LKRFYIAIVTCAVLALTGCDFTQMVDSQVLEKVRAYFPAAEIRHVSHNHQLQIVTHLSGGSEEFYSQVMTKFLQEHASELAAGLPLGGYQLLTVDFEEGACLWNPQNRLYFFYKAKPFPENQFHVYPSYVR